MVFRPNWDISARPSFEQGYVQIDICIDTVDTDKENAPEYRKPIFARGGSPMRVDDLPDKEALYFRFLHDIIPPMHEHEDREFLRDPDSLEAPFHPHKKDGMMGWLVHQFSADMVRESV
jgi:hypothetical protein